MKSEDLDNIYSLLIEHKCMLVDDKNIENRFYMRNYAHPKLMNPIAVMLDKEKDNVLAMGARNGIPKQLSTLTELKDFLKSVANIPQEKLQRMKT